MNEEVVRKAMSAIEKMAAEMDETQKDHFASVLTLLANCYGEKPKWRGSLVMSDGTRVIALGINANEYELTGLIHAAHNVLNANIAAEAPDSGLYN